MAKRSSRRAVGSDKPQSRLDHRWDDAGYTPDDSAGREQDTTSQEQQLRDLLVGAGYCSADSKELEEYIQEAKNNPKGFTLEDYIQAVNDDIAANSQGEEQQPDTSNNGSANVTSESAKEARDFNPERWSENELAVNLADNPTQLKALNDFIANDQKSRRAGSRAWSMTDSLARAKATGQFGLPDLPEGALAIIRRKANTIQRQRTQQGGRANAGSEAVRTAGTTEAKKAPEQKQTTPEMGVQELFGGVSVDRMGELLYHIDNEKILEVFGQDDGSGEKKVPWKTRQAERLNVLADFGMISEEQKNTLAANPQLVNKLFQQAYGEWKTYKKQRDQEYPEAAKRFRNQGVTEVGRPPQDEGAPEGAGLEEAKTNQQLASELADILDGKLTVDAADRVRYGIGIRALGRNGLVQNSGGRFVSPEQLAVIAANADLIRNNLPNRDGEAEPDAPEGGEPGTEPETGTNEAGTPGAEANPTTSPDSPPEEPPTEPTPEDTPTEPEAVERRPLVLSFVDETHDALAAARDAAEARLRNEIQSEPEGANRFTRGFKRFVRNIWKGEHGFARAYYREKYKKEALEQIEQQNDVLAHETGDLDARTRAQVATIERFQSEYDESIHKEAGEERNEVAHNTEFARRTKELIARYVSGEITDAGALEEERGRMLQELQDSGNEQLIGEGKVRIDNLVAIADQVKAMVDHGESIERVLDGMKIYSGEARSNVRTEAHITKVEQIIDKLQRRTVLGGLIGPVGLGAAAAGVIGVFHLGRGTLAKATAVTGIPGVITGGLAGYREWTRLKEERALHSREMAQGKRYNEGDKRRERMEATRYETKQATQVAAQLNELLNGNEEPGADAVQAAYHAIAKIEANISRSDKEKIDFLEFSDVANVEQERRNLDVARATAKVRLKSHLAKLPAEFRTKYNIDDSKPINESLAAYVTEMDKDITSEVTAKDKVYAKLRNRRVAAAVAIGTVGGFTAGLAAQELVAFTNSNYDGLVEHMMHGNAPSADGRQTVLEGWFHGQPGEHITASDKYVPHSIGANKNNIDLPDNYKVVNNPDGSFGIEAPNGTKVADNLELNKHGKLTKDSLAILTDKKIEMYQDMVDSGKTEKVSVKEYLKLHKDDVTHVKRDFWYDNNTPKPKFDKNELGLDWGGKDHAGVGKNGSIKMTVGGMTSGGSYHGGEHVSWREAAKDGDLKLAVSASRGTQTDVMMVKIKPDGSIDIPKDHPARKFFTVDKNGHARFKGAFAEVVEVRGTRGGVTHIAPLATITGENSVKHVSEGVKVPHIKLTPPEINTPGREVEGFGVPMWTHRRPLEKLVSERNGDSRGGYNRYGYGYDGENRTMTDNISPRLESDPASKLRLGDELDWFAHELEQREGAEYVNKIRDTISSSDELRNLSPDIRTLTTIPVAAASESDNIFKTLSLYAQQDTESLRRNAILLNVNWLDVVAQNSDKQEKIKKTFAEIERARQAFPDLNIAIMTKEYKAEEVMPKGGVIGYVASDLMNTALLALQERISSGDLSSDADVAIVRQDADMQGMSRHFLQSLEKGMDNNPGTDILNGTIRLDAQMHDRYPGFGIVTNFNESIAKLNAAENRPWTVGINMTVRAASLGAVGGLGTLRWSGPASDDVNVGWRIEAARNGVVYSPNGTYGYNRRSRVPGAARNRIVANIPGMVVDSASDRLLPKYLEGKHFGAAWDASAANGKSFSDGPGGYRERTADSDIIKRIRREDVRDGAIYKRIEENISSELRYTSAHVARRALAVFFGDVPNGYIIKGVLGDNEPVEFRLTREGRKFIRDRIERESNGIRNRGSSYGRRKMRQLYGRQYRGGRKPVAQSSPLVSPVGG